MTSYKKIMVKASEFGSRDFATATHIVEVSLPETPPGHVCIKVGSTGIEASDVIQMAGGYGDLQGKTPATEADGSRQLGDIGCEGVGTITDVGEGVDPAEWSVGQAVIFTGFGVSFREYIHFLVEVDSTNFSQMWKVPDVRPEWTAMPVSAMTAVGGLEMAGKIKEGQTVLVTGAMGGTGHIAVQWAKRRGCRVAGTCGGAEKAAVLKSLGCDVTVDYRTEDVEAVLRAEFPEGFDLVYEGVGGKVGNSAKRLLSATGTCVSIGAVSHDYSGQGNGDQVEEKVEPLPDQTHTGFFCPNGAKEPVWPSLCAEVIASVIAGEMKILMDAECGKFPLGMEGVYNAQERMRSGKNVGKIYARISE